MQYQNYNYNKLKKISNYSSLNTCFSPSDPVSYRTPRDMLEYKTHVIDKEILHQNNKEGFCSCSNNTDCGVRQLYNRNLDKIESDYVSGKTTEYNFQSRQR
jgi:hypothetical protein